MTVWMAWETGGKKKTPRAKTAARVNVVLKSAQAQTSLRSLRKLDCVRASRRTATGKTERLAILRYGAPQVGCSGLA
jgi:hypothetical protein